MRKLIALLLCLSLTPAYGAGSKDFTPDNRIDIGDLRDEFVDKVSVSAWVIDDDASSFPMIFSAHSTTPSGDNTEGFELRTNAATGFPEFTVDTAVGGRPQAIGSVSIVDANWHHLLGTYDDPALKIYVDGVFIASTTTGSGNIVFGPAGSTWRIGSRGSIASGFFAWNGRIFNPRIRNIALTPDEVLIDLQCMNQPISGLVGQWTMMQDDNVYEDLSTKFVDGSCSDCPANSDDSPPTSWCVD